ncbi:MAG: hypothetical protein AUG06_06350 [Actinobacteria bacterium 13_1_20CM_2_65_11]|nr:MAG: hypothetical protein AUH40_04995 [Chloroflexi bacterium 13_1_40CM_65_17]OLC64275.1 MAG: hypothetical protein AUH69_12555 [Actinobacteria bacterium 13_1_40CM_4_65_12]OLD25870.1 MAG: hypothetical protein AUJ02_03995 [Chloroflexi bacterium 13_1_40CM_3_65_12]OLD50496.1 MAG: hypothetical protein AUI42_03040 [Actinobacteria bacterium 13_1_40CM_2_65_8]OLE79995.1 MAG: hypothetical protein AUG06_06350 [Actinobacteria bacterium 13_1_20CM_2_65_11]
MVLPVASATIQRTEGDASESRRRSLMTESDSLLDDVERLRLDDQVEVPQTLRDSIRELQVRLGRADSAVAPATLHAAHDLVFAVQQRLMAANPKHPRPNRHAGRPEGQPVIAVVRDGGLWKLLTLPPPPGGAADEAWLELVDCTVERAWDRWCYAQQHAVRAAQERYKPHIALAVARTAWTNYWELYIEAGEIRDRVRAATSARPPGSAAGPHD